MRPIIWIVLCHAACADPVEDLGPAELVLGAGPEGFVPVTDGDSVAIMEGLQGGTVMWGAVQARNVDARDVELLFTVTPPAGPPSAEPEASWRKPSSPGVTAVPGRGRGSGLSVHPDSALSGHVLTRLSGHLERYRTAYACFASL